MAINRPVNGIPMECQQSEWLITNAFTEALIVGDNMRRDVSLKKEKWFL